MRKKIFQFHVCKARLISTERLRVDLKKIHTDKSMIRDRKRKKTKASEEKLYLNNVKQTQNKVDNERFEILIKEILPRVEIGQAYNAFTDAIQPRIEDLLDIYNCIKSNLNDVLRKIYNNYEIYLYGSTLYGLALSGEYY